MFGKAVQDALGGATGVEGEIGKWIAECAASALEGFYV